MRTRRSWSSFMAKPGQRHAGKRAKTLPESSRRRPAGGSTAARDPVPLLLLAEAEVFRAAHRALVGVHVCRVFAITFVSVVAAHLSHKVPCDPEQTRGAIQRRPAQSFAAHFAGKCLQHL